MPCIRNHAFRQCLKPFELFFWGAGGFCSFLQIRSKFAKFLETCYKEKLQLLQGTTSYNVQLG